MRKSGLVGGVAALAVLIALLLSAQRGRVALAAPDGTTRIPVVFSKGHDTDPRDKGRPVILIASALGVPPEVFREAFSHVHPAPAGQRPDPEDVHQNKQALLQALAPYGVTNERLDEVSNYYRYQRSRGEMWPTQEASADALLKDGKVIGFEVKSGGSGYSSPPIIQVSNAKGELGEVQLAFSQTFEQNGAVAKIVVSHPEGR